MHFGGAAIQQATTVRIILWTRRATTVSLVPCLRASARTSCLLCIFVGFLDATACRNCRWLLCTSGIECRKGRGPQLRLKFKCRIISLVSERNFWVQIYQFLSVNNIFFRAHQDGRLKGPSQCAAGCYRLYFRGQRKNLRSVFNVNPVVMVSWLYNEYHYSLPVLLSQTSFGAHVRHHHHHRRYLLKETNVRKQ